ncbi:MAG: mandelate racemase/muconate lactonizing enzyme family protein [Chloroflexi bacterium]|nr:mandelate racemase/muconate lactonizing enzyme family protein [Chloroflexota bacterium]
MKVTGIEVFPVKSLGRPWLYCAVRTDEGITGYSEFGVGDLAKGLTGLVDDLSRHIIGKDPRSVEQHYTNMVRSSRSAFGGATWMAIAGIELALWDVKGKAMGVPVHELVGGPTRTEQKVYWSHLVSFQSTNYKALGREPLRNYDDIKALVRMAIDAGYDTMKTNIQIPGEPFRTISQGTAGPHDQVMERALRRAAVDQISAMREEGGPDANICLDVNVNFKAESQIRLGQALEPYDLMWMEIDNLDAESLRMVKDATRTPICSGEQKLGPLNYLELLQNRSMDFMKLDVQWQGFIPARRAANMAELFDINVAPHNYNSHLSNFQTMNMCASINNVRISESDPVQAPWREELFTVLPEVNNGMMKIPTGPGWGTDLREDMAKKYAYTG